MTIEELKAFGADTETGLRRCLNNESFYLRMVKMMPDDPNFQRLRDALEACDLDAAFAAAHALKGSTTNLALTPISDPVCEITELLCARTQTDYMPLAETIRQKRDELAHICES